MQGIGQEESKESRKRLQDVPNNHGYNGVSGNPSFADPQGVVSQRNLTDQLDDQQVNVVDISIIRKLFMGVRARLSR